MDYKFRRVLSPHLLEDLSGALCRADEGLVVVEGQLLGGVEHQALLLFQALWLRLCSTDTVKVIVSLIDH